ncbi:MAG: peptide-methionine (S)-S-oxide reductase MsrA [Trueperaceae bacterium]|nr:peptide-methionine (S)-S-oxide reductase MsrA [Trueperaceae bacterium]
MSETTTTAVLAGGCFWCLEAVFDGLRGVSAVRSGYAGGHVADPSYEDVCTGRTGHAEVVAVDFDPAEVSYADLLRVYFTMHDPTTKDRQGNDVGSQYRSAIFYRGDDQRATAESVMREVSAAGIYDAPLVTELRPLEAFYPAEAYHDDYFARNPRQPYCQAVIAPKVQKFRKLYRDRLKRELA